MARKTKEKQGNSTIPGQFEPETPENVPETPEIVPKRSKSGLFDPGALSPTEAAPAGTAVPDELGKLDLNELLALRERIDEHLPPRALSEVDLQEELLLQYARTKALYDDVVGTSNVPANQRAQVANSCSSILEQLIKMQGRLYNAERVKAMESVLIKTLKEFPTELQETFFTRYEAALAAAAA